MWVVQQQTRALDWFTRSTVHDQIDAENLAQLYKSHAPHLHFRICPADDEYGEPIDGAEIHRDLIMTTPRVEARMPGMKFGRWTIVEPAPRHPVSNKKRFVCRFRRDDRSRTGRRRSLIPARSAR